MSAPQDEGDHIDDHDGTELMNFGVGGPDDTSPLRFLSVDMIAKYQAVVDKQRQLAQQQLFYCDQLDKMLAPAPQQHVQD